MLSKIGRFGGVWDTFWGLFGVKMTPKVDFCIENGKKIMRLYKELAVWRWYCDKGHIEKNRAFWG
jgi:hypothetical protein